jgi:DNA-binding NtrC family response regulator
LILIVEDDSSQNVELAKLIRKECGVEVVSAFSVRGAIAILDGTSTLTAVICDNHLPDGRAKDIFDNLVKKRKTIPFLVYGSGSIDIKTFNAPFFLGVISEISTDKICDLIKTIKATQIK